MSVTGVKFARNPIDMRAPSENLDKPSDKIRDSSAPFRIDLLDLPEEIHTFIIRYLQTPALSLLWNRLNRYTRAMGIPTCMIRRAREVGYEGEDEVGSMKYLSGLHLEVDQSKKSLSSHYTYQTSGALDYTRTLLQLQKASLQKKNIYLLTYAELRCSKLVKWMLWNKADPGFSSVEGDTALHHAASNGDAQSVRVLLKERVEGVNQKNTAGHTALFNACFFNGEGSYEVVQLLLSAKADPNCTSYCGSTPLQYAVRKGDERIVRYLLENKALAGLRNNYGDTALCIASFTCYPPNRNIIGLLLQHTKKSLS